MTNPELERESLAADIILRSIKSLDFMKDANTAISDSKLSSITVKNLYDVSLEKMNQPRFVPYNFGVIFGNLYCGILLAKENWYNLLPNDELSESDPSWHLSDVTCTPPNLAVQYVIRRIRNALAHGKFIINVPEDREKTECMLDMEKSVTIKFYDNNFDIELSLYKLEMIVRKFHGIAYEYVTSKI